MSRSTIATVVSLVFIAAYIAAVVTLPDLVGRQHWAVEAVYWLVAGVAWVGPVAWLMLWSAGKR